MMFSKATTFHRQSAALLCLGFVLLCTTAVSAQSNFTVRVMAANLPGNPQKYEDPQIRILQGLDPDVVAIQEFNYLGNSTPEIRSFVDTAFGTNFVYYREPGYSIPNGVISRWPILSSGSWPDAVVPNRGFAWAQIDLPGTNDLYVVSVHLYASGSATDRNNEAIEIKSQVQANFPSGAWVVVAGDMNTSTRSESAINTFKTFLSDSPIPTDAISGGNEDTNLNRNKPYDYVLPSFSMTSTLTNVVIGAQSFPKGLVFDSRVFTPLSAVSPVQFNDSANCQHMAVLKDFYINAEGGTNPPPAGPVITDQPDSLVVTEGNNAAFTVTATGAAPLAYQWRFNGVAIPAATNTAYTRLNAQLADAGDYTVVVTNSSGSVTSSVAVLTVTPSGGGPVDIITQWNFNSVPPDADTTTGTLVPTIGTGIASAIGGVTQPFFSGSGSTDPATEDDSAMATQNYPAQGTANKTAGVQYAVSTLGKENISIAWDVRASNTGSKYARLQYTTNGTTFVDFPAAVINPTSFGRRTNDLTAFPGVADNPNFAVRIVSEFENTATGSGSTGYVGAGGTYGTGGTLRYDMVTVYGSTIGIPPEITVQPLSQNLAEGDGLFLSVVAGGTPPLSYQWHQDLAAISGATNTSYSIGSVVTNDSGGYSVTVSSPYGAVTSTVATVVVYMPVNIVTPFAGATAIWGLDALLSVGATGTGPLTYQWYQDALQLAGATSNPLLIPNVQVTNAGLYSVVVSNPYSAATSGPAMLTVIPAGISLDLYTNLAGLTITGAVGNTLAIEYTGSFAATNAWLLATNLTLQQQVELWLDESAEVQTQTRRFYRAVPGP